MIIEYCIANSSHIPSIVAAGDQLFDYAVRPHLLEEFISDPRHHLLLALEKGRSIGFASAVHYIHPDKEAQLFINEVSVLESHQKQGIGRTLVKKLIEHGKGLGCTESWVGTELDNTAARKAYKAAGGKETDEFVLIEF